MLGLLCAPFDRLRQSAWTPKPLIGYAKNANAAKAAKESLCTAISDTSLFPNLEAAAMDTRLVFCLGMVGALAPEIVRLYELRAQRATFQWSSFYAIISLLFAALGGVLALALPATNYFGAIYVGISTPLLINQILKRAIAMPIPSAKKAPQIKDQPKRHASIAVFLRGL